MTDLASDAYIKTLDDPKTELWTLDSSAAQTVYKGQPMIIDQSEDTLNLRAYIGATVVAATDVFVGIAAEGDVVGASDRESDHQIQVYVAPSIIGFKSAVYTNADLGAIVYMSDSGVLSATAADNPQIGILHRVEGGYAFVRLVSPQVCTGA